MEMQQESRRSYEITISDTFPDIPSSPCSHIIDQIRSTIIDFLLQRLPDEIIKLRNQFPSECDSTEIEVVLYSLPPDTEFDLPNLLNIARSAVVPTKESSPSESTASEWLGLDESNADNAPTALSALKTEYGDCIPDKLKTTGVTQYLMKRPARNPLRPNTQFSHVRSPYSIIRLHSLHAGLLQASGLRQAHSRRCVDCVEGKGFWDSCVVATPDMPYDFMKACANCCYSGKPGRCSFSPGRIGRLARRSADHSPSDLSACVFQLDARFVKYTSEMRSEISMLINYRTRNYPLSISVTHQQLRKLIADAVRPLLADIEDFKRILPSTEDTLAFALTGNGKKIHGS